MGIFSRLNRVIKSNLNALIDQAEDADKMIGQTVADMKSALKRARKDLIEAMRKNRPDLKVWWLPAVLLRLGSPFLKLLQRVLLGSRTPVDVYAAFASEKYNCSLAAKVVQKATTGGSLPGG